MECNFGFAASEQHLSNARQEDLSDFTVSNFNFQICDRFSPLSPAEAGSLSEFRIDAVWVPSTLPHLPCLLAQRFIVRFCRTFNPVFSSGVSTGPIVCP
jgi:hypothetical protein